MARPQKDYIRTNELAAILGVTGQTIYNWLRAGKIPEPARTPGGQRMFKERDIEVIRRLREAA